jgi:hypothetical protein
MAKTAAERQKLYRQNKSKERNENVTDSNETRNVTERNAPDRNAPAKQGIPGQELLIAVVPVAYIKDATGTEHRVDYARRRTDWLLLEACAAEGKGTVASTTTTALAEYLGIDEELAGRLLAKRKVGVKPEQSEATVNCLPQWPGNGPYKAIKEFEGSNG